MIVSVPLPGLRGISSEHFTYFLAFVYVGRYHDGRFMTVAAQVVLLSDSIHEKPSLLGVRFDT